MLRLVVDLLRFLYVPPVLLTPVHTHVLAVPPPPPLFFALRGCDILSVLCVCVSTVVVFSVPHAPSPCTPFRYPYLQRGELTEAVRLLYKGTLRVLLVLLHDFPEFLCEHHFQL